MTAPVIVAVVPEGLMREFFGSEDLEALAASVRRLRDIVEAVSRERLEELRRAAGQDGGPSG